MDGDQSIPNNFGGQTTNATKQVNFAKKNEDRLREMQEQRAKELKEIED